MVKEAWIPPYDEWAKEAELTFWFGRWRDPKSQLGFEFLYKDGKPRPQYPRRDDWSEQVLLGDDGLIKERSISVDHREVKLLCPSFLANACVSQHADEEPTKLSRSVLLASDCEDPAEADTTRETTVPPTEAEEALCAMLQNPDTLLSVLELNQDELITSRWRRFAFQAMRMLARASPALVIYGGTISLLVCAICQYRWGVLLALTLFTFYMLHLCVTFLIFAAVGLMRVFHASKEDWAARAAALQPASNADDEEDITTRDVLHVVMLPTFCTPLTVLEHTLTSLAQYSQAKGQLAVCLAFEEREEEAQEKEKSLRQMFADTFFFIHATYHPSNLPNHLPGKSSNECWAFQQLCRELEEVYQILPEDPRVVITVIDDDSDMHSKYFEALTHHFVAAGPSRRYLNLWQAPICHFKNFLRQPLLVRISSLFSTLNELSCLANPWDCHVPYSSYSISFALACAVGGWDPEYLAEDWHMFAKCSLKTMGRAKCVPIFLPVLNYTPEEDTYCSTLWSRWTQAKRHALGVSEVVYVLSFSFLALLELRSCRQALVFLWRLLPLLAKFAQTHFVNGVAAVWNVMAQIVIHFYMFGSWCDLQLFDTPQMCPLGAWSTADLTQEQVLRNSLLVFLQQRGTALMAFASILSGGLGAIYFHMVKDRVEGNVDEHWKMRNLPLMWLIIELEVSLCGLVQSFIFGALPLWIACIRIMSSVRFSHVAAGMVGRSTGEVSVL
ncbi:hypothetical protein AK812_SmicGene4512 [Symbiodinium microadriaticum]|uniref:Glycosyltransferase 2-like domain-containing protein n=1 Tax=Symbiodinium microadriaticum TaxID=2951 RepID=A0A1Q9EW28_SYMMI|nr:hypothetical protein AK812_SmicGene4512 [Symbiodinium microadriaticum]